MPHAAVTTEQTAEPRVVLIGRPGCHLCDEARVVVRQITQKLNVAWREVDIDQEPDFKERYAELIPVVLVDGREHAQFQVDPQRFEAALQGRSRWWRRD